MRKASLEGMSEAFGSSAEADDRGRRGQGGGGGRNLVSTNIAVAAAPHKRELGTAAMRPLQIDGGGVRWTGSCNSWPRNMPGAPGPKAFWQKKRPHPKMGPYDRTGVQI